MLDLYSDKSTCCGCGACKSVCPKSAISMETDEYGFIHPKIDRNLCIECYLCINTCAFKNVEISNKRPMQSYIGINKNTNDLLVSASGGAFSAIAKYVLDKNGAVIGCAWNNELIPEHIIIDNYENLCKLQSSKYVQSNTESIFIETKKLLSNDKIVFFTGTPCQVAELKEFLGKDYEQLLTADLICHGVPSIEFFNKYKEWYERKNKCKVVDINFRDKKKYGWSLMGTITIKKDDKIKYKELLFSEDPYYYLFMYGYSYRDSCYSCKYACSDRKGDLTFGDFWGVQKYYPELDRRKGISAILVNTCKGEKIIGQIKDYINFISTKYENIEENNNQLKQPTEKPKDREVWLEYWKIGGFDLVAREFYRQKRKQILASKIRRNTPKTVKRIIKRLLRVHSYL